VWPLRRLTPTGVYRPLVPHRECATERRAILEHRAIPKCDGGPSSSGDRHLHLLQWGLVPHWTKDAAHAKTRPINARAETVASSGMFRAAFSQRRCIVPAEAFYEWKAVEGGKQPFAIARQDGQLMAFAGLWEGYRWPDGTLLRTYTIVTTRANAEMVELHDRMPVILEARDWPAWLGETPGDPTELMHPAPDGTLGTWPVSRMVNTPRNNSAELLIPVAS
jgi:putative SOS response-associated peptidase YedK